MGFMERMRTRIQKPKIEIEPEKVASTIEGRYKIDLNTSEQQGSTKEADKKKIDTVHQEIYSQFKNLERGGAKGGVDSILRDKGMN